MAELPCIVSKDANRREEVDNSTAMAPESDTLSGLPSVALTLWISRAVAT